MKEKHMTVHNRNGFLLKNKLPGAMKLTMLSLAFSLSTLSANADAQQVSVTFKNAEVHTVLNTISKQTGLSLAYSSQVVDLNRKVSINLVDKDVDEVLAALFDKTTVDYEIREGKIYLFKAEKRQAISQQSFTVTGTVVDPSGLPVIGANVLIQGTSNGTITDIDGKFSLEVTKSSMLVVSYIGFSDYVVKVTEKGPLFITLKEDAKALEEVVVVGYGTQKKVNLTGAVSSVSAEELEEVPSASLSSALSGKISGVLITQSGGKPGAGASMTVRAQGTWNNTEPLYVIDGVVRDKFAFDGLDMSEIEALSVLKDGASAAIYGARAANGVVLVTTKKGKVGKPIISYTGSVGFSDATKIPKTQNAYNQAVFINDNLRANDIDEVDSRYYTQDELDYFKGHNYNWLDESWKKPILTRHSINVNGGNDRIRYFIGGSYYYETGSFKNLSFKKYNLRSNLEANITKDLVVSLNLNIDRRNDDKPYWKWDGDKDTMSDLYKGLLFRTGQVAPYIDGKPTGTFVEWHPLEILEDHTGYNRKRFTNYEATAVLSYNVPFIKGLNLKFQYNSYNRDTFIKQFNRPYTLYNFKMTGGHNHIVTNEVESTKVRNDGDFLYEKYDNNNNYQLNFIANYSNTFGKHDVGALFVYEQSEGTVNWFDGQRNLFISSAVDQMFAGSSDSKESRVNGSGSETGRISYVGRLNYAYNQKYLIEASFRYDGSVNFAPENRWGFFPSGSVAWRISEEDFFKNNVTFVDYLKLRASVGLLGNDAVGGWQWLQRYGIVEGAQFGSLTSGVESNVLPNKDITWEKSLTYNFGFDANLFKSRVTLSVDAFHRHTYDILGNRIASLPTTFGAKMPAENYAVINSRGFEVELGYKDKIGKDFSYYVKGNLGYATNEVKVKDEAENLRAYKSEIGHNTDRLMGYIATGIIRTQADLDALPEGYQIFGQKPELGMMNYRDLRGANSDEPDGIIDENDQDWIIDHTVPPINYGVSVGGSWKGFAVDVFFQGVAGNDIMINMRGHEARAEATNFDFWTDHWTPENVNAKFPGAGRSNSGRASTFWTKSGSFLRLKNLNISYTLPKHITQNLNLGQLRFFFTGNNLCLLQNKLKYYDPENSSIIAYPLMKNYSFGVNLSF